MKRVLLIRTYRDVGAGGAVPPSGLLYAASSGFDAAYFFKATPYRGTELYNSLPVESRPSGESGFFSSGPAVSARDAEVNAAILYAQRKFYLSPRRLWRLLRKSHNTAGFPADPSEIPGGAAAYLHNRSARPAFRRLHSGA